METVFLLKPLEQIKTQNSWSLDKILSNKEQIKKAINLNTIKHYNKVNIPSKGEYVVRCNNRHSLYKESGQGSRDRTNGNLGLVFVVDTIMKIQDTYGIWDRDSGTGYYLEGIRMATEDEINFFRTK